MDWEKIDLFPRGPAGIEARWRKRDGIVYCYLQGSDHWVDWLHHFLPFAKTREIIAGEIIADRLRAHGSRFVIGGHSLGGAIAVVVADCLREGEARVSCLTFGGKRPPVEAFGVTAYQYRGDPVPFLPPRRPKYKNVEMFGKWRPFWIAHGPRTYYDLQRQHGFRA